MGFLTKYGTLWGQVPQTAGQVFWVAPGAGGYIVDGKTYHASDDNDGLSPERAFATADRGINLAVNNGDVVVLLPGTHTAAASLAMDSAGVTLTGLPGGAGNPKRPKTTLTVATGGGEVINVTAANCEVVHLRISGLTAVSAVDFTAAATGLYIHRCSFDMQSQVASTGTIGIESLGAAASVVIEDVHFLVGVAHGHAITATGMVDGTVRDCTFHALSGSYTWLIGVLIGAATTVLFQRCTFSASGAAIIGIPIDGTGANLAASLTIHGCIFPVSMTGAELPFGAAFTAGEVEMAENYVMDVGAASGGTLVSAIV